MSRSVRGNSAATIHRTRFNKKSKRARFSDKKVLAVEEQLEQENRDRQIRLLQEELQRQWDEKKKKKRETCPNCKIGDALRQDRGVFPEDSEKNFWEEYECQSCGTIYFEDFN